MMKRGTIMVVMASMFLIFLVNPVGDMMASSMEPSGFATNRSITSDGENAFTEKGVDLSVQFNGVFFNGTSWSDTNNTLAEDLTTGSTFSVSNDSVTDWSAYVLVSPPYNISSMNFTVTKPPSMTGSKSWNLTGVTDPDGDSRLSEVTDSATEVIVPTAAVDVFGLWKFEFNQTNGATDLQCGINGGSYATTFTYDVGDSASFKAYAPVTAGSAMRLLLTDPSGQLFYASDDTTQGAGGDFEWTGITVTSSWDAGVWYADVNFNDTSGAAPKFVGRYKRSFIVKHDTSLTLQAPGDAVSDKLSVRTAGEMLHLEVQLVDDDNSQSVTGATVTMNWTVLGVPTDITLEDYGTGDYGVALNTSDLGDAKRWRIEINSYHQYYNNATTYFDLDLFHSTELTYTSLSTTPVGSDSTVTLVYRDTYDDVPIVGATIAFANGTLANVVAEGGGLYNLSVNTGTLGLGDDWYIFNASKSGSFVEMASTNITFTMRKHYTSVTVIGDLVTPHGQTTPVTVVITDLDTGTELGTTTDVTTWSFTSSYAPVTETPPDDFAVTLTTNTWSVGPETVTLSVTMSGIYENPTNYLFDVEIRKHYTSVTVLGDLVTPHGQTTPVTVVIIDLDTGTVLSSTGSVSSWSFTSTNPAITESNPADFDVTLTTNTWSVGPETVTLSVTMSGIYENPTNYLFDVEIRKHYTSVTVIGDLVTPSGQTTPVTVVITDLDTGTELGTTTDVTTWSFTSGYAPVTETPPADFAVTLTTNTWSVGTEAVTLSVTMSGIYENPTNYLFDVEIRKHYTSVTVIGDLVIPHGQTTPVTVVITDLDTGTVLSSTGSVSSWSFTSTNPAITEPNPADFDVTLTTNTWSLGTEAVTLSVTMSGIYENPTNYLFDVEIRKHYTSVTVLGDLVTPHGQTTPVTVVIIDLDTGTVLSSTGSVSSWSFTSTNPAITESNPADFDVTLTTNTWSLGTEAVTLSVTMSGIYENPTNYLFDVEIRKHYTSVTVLGDLVTPHGQTTPVTVVIIDLDTGTVLSSTGSVSSWSFTSTNPAITESNPADFDVTLTTNTWSVGPETVTLSVTMSGVYENPTNYQFDIQVRNHYTSISVSGGLVTPFGNVTPLTIIVTDLDTATTLSASDLSAFTFTSSYSPYSENNPTDLDLDLPTNAWIVGIETVTLSVTMTGNYDNPTNYLFDITIRSMSTYLYNEPSDLVFPSGDDFEIYLRVNVSEPGTSYGLPVTALTQGEFSVESYTISIDTADQSVGRYKLTISESFGDGDYTIIVHVDPNNQSHASAVLVISFTFRPARSFLSSPNYPQVTTPFEMDVQITLNYTDVDRELGIDLATIGNESINIYTVFDVGDGTYTLWIDVTGLSEGPHEFNLTANKDGYELKYLTFTVLIRVAYTYAIPTVGALDIPVGNDPQFYVKYWDIDHDEPVLDASWVSDWDHALAVVYVGGEQRYQVTLPTLETDTLRQNYVVNITFHKGNYQNGTFTISITIRTHNTDFRLVSAVEPTSFIGVFNISVYYGDLDNPEGIKSQYAEFRVENASGPVTFNPYNDTALGPGFYIMSVPASQFPQGMQTFTVYVNWTGSVYMYQNKTLVATANIIGEESSLTLLIASEPTPYLGNMSYVFFFSDVTSGVGIDNLTSHVHIYVSFQGESVDQSQITITDYSATQPGNYSIEFNTTIFGHTGLIYMDVYINWSKGVAPFYDNRTDVISVRILPRDTIISITPPSPTSYNENATFVFYFEDVTGGLNEPIADDPVLSIALNLTENPAVTYDPIEKSFTVSFNTSQFGSPLGTRAFILNVTWAGAPFYGNRTGRIIFITVMARQTVVEYLAPAPTQYRDNVTFTVVWTDVTGAGSTGIDGANLILLDDTTPIGATYYSVTPLGNGEYEVELNTTYYTELGTNDLVVELSAGVFYILDRSVTREFNVRQRITLLSANPVAKVAYNSSIEIILYYQDLYTLDDIGNASGLTSLEILTAGIWLFTCEWNGTFGYYILTVETHNHPGLLVDTPYTLHLNITYAIQAPFYGPDDIIVAFELRERASSLDIEEPPDPTPYLDYAVFQVFYRDVDSSTGIVIGIDDISLEKGGVPLVQGTDYLITDNGAGYYTISVNTTALNGLGITAVDIFAIWIGGSPYHEDADMTVSIRVTKRETNVEITVPPSITQFLDNVTFTFAYTDLLRATPITSITASDIELWADGILLLDDDFMMSQIGGSFLISVNSTILNPNLVSNYNLTVKVDWNDATPPFYFDDTTLVRVTTTNRVITYSIDEVQDAGLGENISISFSLSDEDTGVPVGSVIIDFDGQTVSLTRDVDFWVVEGSGVDLGKYTIYIDSSALYDPGTYNFNLNVSWNPSTQPYYANKSTIVLTGIVRAIETSLIPIAEQVTVLWKEGAPVSVDYQNIFVGNLTPGASVNWTWPGIAQGSFIETGTPGRYTAIINTTLDYAGTIVLIIEAKKDRYQLAITYVTIVVQSLPSKLVGIDPADLVLDIDRGGAVHITVYLNDTVYAIPIPDLYVTQVRANFEGEFYYLVYNGTPGYYNTTIPAAGPTILPPAAYDVRLVAAMVNYDPAAYLFKIHLSQTKTELLLAGDTTEDMSRDYTEIVELRVDLVLPDIGYASFPNATVSWYISELGADGNFTSMGNGTYYIVFDTTDIGFGIWPISFRAQPWLNASEYAASATQMTLNIKRIATTVEREGSEIDLVWGWVGSLRFNYTGTFGLIANATGAYTVGSFQGNAIDLGNGTYLVPLDSTVLGADSTYTLNILFTLENYQEGPSSVKVNVIPVPMELVIDIHSDYADPVNLGSYVVPYGMLINITLLYNDTDSSDGYVGGLENANLTLSEMRGPTRQLTLFAIDALGNGYYSYLFDTTNPWLFEQISTGVPGPHVDPYILSFRLALANRSTITREVMITIIALPTIFEVVSVDTALEYGQTGQMVVKFIDDWPGHAEGTLVTGANFTIDDSTILQLLEITSTYEDPTRPGYYIIEYRAVSMLFGNAQGLSSIDVTLSLPNVADGKLSEPLLVSVAPTEMAQTLNTVFVFGTPLLLIIVVLLVAYVKVWSVPKRLRQINSQVKALRKGKIPKPVDDVKGRSELIAELFNDTYSDLAITRVPAQMPEESVLVDIPEMGELLIQLAILTNLDQTELDEFKADISKMKISEQAAFVKEVIHQEAIRAARSEGKEIDEILKTVQNQARSKLSDAAEEIVKEDVVSEPEILTEEEKKPEVESEPGKGVPSDVRKEFEVSSDVDKLSTFELEDLKMNLVRKGIQPHEIETIMEQVRELPRDLVDELLKSFGVDKE